MIEDGAYQLYRPQVPPGFWGKLCGRKLEYFPEREAIDNYLATIPVMAALGPGLAWLTDRLGN